MDIKNLIATSIEPFYSGIVIAILIILIGLIIGQLLSRLIKKLLHELKLNKLINISTGLNLPVESVISTLVKYIVNLFFLFWALQKLNLGELFVNVIAGGILAIIVVSLLLGIKDFMRNAVAGLFITFKGIVKIGDFIKCNDVSGEVTQIELTQTIIETKSSDVIYIPNSILVKNIVIKSKN